MGVRNKSSEYRRSFKKNCSVVRFYESNVDYRLQRRQIEHNHQLGPFLWDSDSETSSDGAGGARKSKRPPHVPVHTYKHEKFNRSYNERLKQLTQQLTNNLRLKDDQQVDRSPRSVQNGESQTDPVVTVDRAVNGAVEKLDKKRTGAVKQQEAVKQVSTQTRPSKPVQKVLRPCMVKEPPTRSLSAPMGRPLKKDEPEQPPFLPYGRCDREFQMGMKKTHNIRASAEIYPSALRAQKRRQTMIDTQERDQKTAALKDKRKQALFNDFNERTKRETSHWDTEYSRCFSGYNRQVYEQSISARPLSRQHDEQLMAATF